MHFYVLKFLAQFHVLSCLQFLRSWHPVISFAATWSIIFMSCIFMSVIFTVVSWCKLVSGWEYQELSLSRKFATWTTGSSNVSILSWYVVTRLSEASAAIAALTKSWIKSWLQLLFFADRTNGRTYATELRPSVAVCRLWRYVLSLNGASWSKVTIDSP